MNAAAEPPCSGLFSEREEKLIRLALDQAAQPGEVRNCAHRLIESLRRRGMRPESLILGSQLQVSRRPETTLAQARLRIMPFGKHRGRRLEAIEPAYLRWTLRKCSNLSLGLREAILIVLAASARC